MERDAAVRLRNWSNRLIYMYANWFTFVFTHTIKQTGKSLRRSGTPGGKCAGCSRVLTALMRFNFCDVVQLRMDPEEPSATYNVSSDER